MSKWAARKRRIDADSDHDPITTIPMLEPGGFDSARARKNISEAFDLAEAKNIIIIDPYLLIEDMEIILELFATQSGRSITVITFLSQAETSEEKASSKTDAATTIKKIADDLIKKGIFESLNIIVTRFSFHDRYFYCNDSNNEKANDGLLVASGSSLGMFLQKYSSLIRVQNKSFRRAVDRFIEKSVKDGRTLADFIGEQA